MKDVRGNPAGRFRMAFARCSCATRSGAAAKSTFMGTKGGLMYSAVATFVYVSRSMRLHQGHHTAPTSRRIGRSSPMARLKASALQGYQSTGSETARFRYGDAWPPRWLGFACD